MKPAWIAATALTTLCFAYTATGAPTTAANDCTGIDVLYPKEGASFSRSEQQTIYLILGNKAHDAKLRHINVARETSDEAGADKAMETGIDKDDTLSKVVVLQQDLNQIEGTMPDKFTFRGGKRFLSGIQVEQDGRDCVYESPSFEVTD
ncbi:hypothetical protein BDB00DRAFT_839496 [Zychaea mexicana]|uniref:uncharacterized protein n=1 Tax=Zychaea mexicana TaxID=64656 RepID=UPI0022FE162A|nr:uncharacterized protein BDB00DRAFT_839496 [Zychaea mexicana]KAI9490074.1 hypothetical protein BDB00DRAFT_839496 [Zychaea mexicana]